MTKDQALAEIATALQAYRARTFDAETFIDIVILTLDDLGLDTTPVFGAGSTAGEVIKAQRERFTQTLAG